ncbi:flocculation protein FLO11-like [Portunus trituberculatus]|uniref:flocculation protein FLO11-like n=1 Tax=Portunus trituberculatus TaxID=210409 RepID=UPI001E1CD421|nr:flocculation protein FLO11-like [Portunus trituberculatus]
MKGVAYKEEATFCTAVVEEQNAAVMKVRWCQFSTVALLVVVVVVVVGFCTAQNSASREDSNESFHPSPLINDSPFSFRPRPRGGRSFDTTGPSFSSPSIVSPSAFRSPNSFPFPSSSEKFSSYSSLKSPSPSASFSSPSFSLFSSPPHISSLSTFIPSSQSFSIVQANGVRLHDTSSSHDSRESFGLPHSPSLDYSAPGISPTLNSHGSTGLISAPQQSYDTLPRVSLPPHNPTPAPIQDYGPSPSGPSHGSSYLPPPTSHHNHDSRERLDSLEIPDNSFGDSIESFFSGSFRDAAPSGTSSFFNSQPTIGFSNPPDRSTSHETFLRPATFNSQSIGFSNPRGTPGSHDIIHRPTTFNPSSGFSLTSSELRSTENFPSLKNHRPSLQRFPSSPSDHLSSSNTFRGPGVGSLSLHDSSETSSELFLRTSGQPQPNLSQQVSGQQQTSFVGAFPNYFFNYNVHDSEEDALDSLGQGKRGPNFGHSERREGSRTEGRYYVELPDGRTQVVEYYADETGYHPTITYI